jgi:hypothetical protein
VDSFEFGLLDLEPVFACLVSFAELSLHNGEDGFNLVALVIGILVKKPNKTFRVIYKDSISFTISHCNKGIGIQHFMNQPVNIFRVLSFVMR